MDLWLTLLLLQVALPMALLAALLLAPAGSRLGWAVQAAATAALLVWLGAAGLWTLPPWWALVVYGVLWGLAVTRGLARWRAQPAWPAGAPPWLGLAAMAVLGLAAVHEAAGALAGRAPPPGEVQTMGFPLAGGTFLVVNGGNDLRLNAHLKTRDPRVPRYARWRGNGHGVDLVAIDAWGLRADGLQPADPRAYRSQGWPVLAPCAGRVLTAVDGLPDMAPPAHDLPARMAGNHVILACGAVHVVLAHFRPGSLRVQAGDAVAAGQPLGEVGNSGVSDEPHLHVHVQRPGTADAPMGGEPLPATFGGRYLVRGQRITTAVVGGSATAITQPASGRPPVGGLPSAMTGFKGAADAGRAPRGTEGPDIG